MRFFPYAYRLHQEDAARSIAETVASGGHEVLEAPTGSGKTITLLAAALEAALPKGLAVVYVTRTNSQHAQAIRELQAIQAHAGIPVRAHAIQGRHHLCLKLEDLDEPEWRGANPEELSHYCTAAKRRAEEEPEDPKGCSYWARLVETDDAALRTHLGGPARTAEEVKDTARAAGFCPYEATKRLLAQADVVVAPYIYAFEPNLRRRLLEWMQRRPDQIVLVVDEAHNVPDYLRRMFSPRLTRNRLRLALKEAADLGDPDVLAGVRASNLLEHLAKALDECVERFSGEDDGFLPPFELEARLLDAFTTTTGRLLEAARNVAALGQVVRDRKRLLGRVPRSHLSGVAEFLETWLAHEDDVSLKLVGRQPEAYLESFLVDTTRVTGFLSEMAATVHASGTLQPLEEYRTSLGLPEETRLRVWPSPLGDAGLTILCARGLTTRYESLRQDPRLVDRLQEAARAVVAAAPVKTAVFFPSHDLHAQFREIGLFSGLPHPSVHEERGMPQGDLMAILGQHRRVEGAGLLVGVMGGRLSEGIDYPGKDLEAVVVVGTPYPKPSAHQRALMQYYERRTGHGWDYAVTAPAIRRLRQAVGRIRRGPEDQGVVVLLDERSGPLLRQAGHAVETLDVPALVERFRTWRPQPGGRHV